MNEQLKNDINLILDYMWDAEETHYEEVRDDMFNPNDHVFAVMQRIKDLVNKVNKI